MPEPQMRVRRYHIIYLRTQAIYILVLYSLSMATDHYTETPTQDYEVMSPFLEQNAHQRKFSYTLDF